MTSFVLNCSRRILPADELVVKEERRQAHAIIIYLMSALLAYQTKYHQLSSPHKTNAKSARRRPSRVTGHHQYIYTCDRGRLFLHADKRHS